MSEPAEHVDVYIGNKGVDASWQGPWPETMECVHCGAEAELIMTAMEMTGGDASICRIHDNDPPRLNPEGEGFWPHDSVAIANYFCRKCFKITSDINQA